MLLRHPLQNRMSYEQDDDRNQIDLEGNKVMATSSIDLWCCFFQSVVLIVCSIEIYVGVMKYNYIVYIFPRLKTRIYIGLAWNIMIYNFLLAT